MKVIPVAPLAFSYLVTYYIATVAVHLHCMQSCLPKVLALALQPISTDPAATAGALAMREPHWDLNSCRLEKGLFTGDIRWAIVLSDKLQKTIAVQAVLVSHCAPQVPTLSRHSVSPLDYGEPFPLFRWP